MLALVMCVDDISIIAMCLDGGVYAAISDMS